jgi:hypothetical protein
MDGVSEPVKEDLQLARDVVDIDRRCEHDPVRLVHPRNKETDIVIEHADPAA